jgi:hypothetical protein
MATGGKCPACGRVLGGTGGTEDTSAVTASGDGSTRLTRVKGAPWHFKLMVVGVTVYMVYRIYWLIEWLPKHL